MRRFKRWVPSRVLALRTALLAVRNLLLEQGQFRSIVQGRSVRADGSAIPWFTYSATAFLEQLDFSDRDLFEYGSGNSTVFWQSRVRRVVAVEDDHAWYAEMQPRIDANRVDYRLLDDANEYVQSISAAQFDIVIIDGSHREQCIGPAIAALRSGGFIILDNSDWFPQLARRLRQSGLLEVDFTGFGPINSYTSTTSLFMKRDVIFNPLTVQPRVGAGGMPENVRAG
jgi:hypothetical protein